MGMKKLQKPHFNTEQDIWNNRKFEAQWNDVILSEYLENEVKCFLAPSRSGRGHGFWDRPRIFVNRHCFDLPKALVGQKDAGYFGAA